MRRIFEAVSAGVLLPSEFSEGSFATNVEYAVGPGLLDPCEKDNVDVAAQLEAQRREDITSSAQHALRLIAFNQTYKILAVDRIKMGGQVHLQNCHITRRYSCADNAQATGARATAGHAGSAATSEGANCRAG